VIDLEDQIRDVLAAGDRQGAAALGTQRRASAARPNAAPDAINGEHALEQFRPSEPAWTAGVIGALLVERVG
jgi:hypothetical protein